MMGAVRISEMSAISARINGATFQKAVILKD
jgi:hypothetical protein